MNERTINLERDVVLAPFTTLRVGGAARFFLRAESDTQVAEAFQFAEQSELEMVILGGGSNVVVSDEGFDGLVVQIAIGGISTKSDDAGTFVTVGAGENWDDFVAHCIENDLAGVECLSGIPGLVGGTPVQNVGAYGQDVAETIVSVKCLDRKTGETLVLSNEECRFAYRSSIFNSTMIGRFIVLSVTFALVPGGKPKLAYRDLIEVADGRQLTLGETREAILNIRRAKSMVIDEADANSRSVGSFFKNPIVSLETADRIAGVPTFKVDDENVKISAAWLIEQAGFEKGFRLGNAGISSNHSLAIINCGEATAAEIVALMDKIKTGVKAKFGIQIVPEPIFVGFST